MKWAEVRLTLTDNAVEAASQLVLATHDVEGKAQRYAPLRLARIRVESVTAADVATADQVARILASAAWGPQRRVAALCDALPGLTEADARLFLVNQGSSDAHIDDVRNRARSDFFVAVNALVDEGRLMLRSRDDQAPAQV
ncbi:hypothetical protein PV721_26705 [Streptomyces sp. MB09-01]|uniref:hypothetical protein n=1 Tax=Streptomyces sp. MB09-01 TaxID=3028666 RepID=UPI0029B0724B|nr:hypothetical protein [Streptomyces sp. MB09-01]MDX3537883.1 hypothetical protein [Streptomyces sp. MB09-01]